MTSNNLNVDKLNHLFQTFSKEHIQKKIIFQNIIDNKNLRDSQFVLYDIEKDTYV